MIETLNKASLQYLENKYISLETATPQQLSDAEAYGACFDWYIEKRHVLPNTADLASNIFVQKYALHDNDGICLEKTPEDMWNRIAKALAEEEVITNPTNPDFNYWFKVFRQLLENWKYTPQGSGLYVLGNTYVKASASNCFVVSTPEDNLESIFDTAKMMARIYAARGGCGVNISGLRPAGSRTNNAAKTSTGASSFMDFYSHVTSTIGQCIEETQIVLTKRGNIAIKDVMAGDLVWTKRGWIGNLETINNGIKPVYRLTTKRGYEILATNNHVFVGTNQDGFDLNEIQLGDFSIGDTIVMMPGTPTNDIQYVKLNTSVSYNQGHGAVTGGNRLNEAITLPDELTEELAYFIGYSFGDGYVELDNYNEVKEISLACSHAHPAIQTKLEAISNNLFSYSPSIRQRKGERCADVRLFSKKLGLYLAQNGLLKQKAGILEMPELVKQSKTSVQMAFISGYFDADGYASGAKKGYVIASICMSMLKNIQQMLMSAGIVSHITTEKRNGLEETKNWQDLHSLFITGAYSQKLAVSLLSESVKVSNKAFIAKRDTLLTPFNAKSYGVKYNNFSYVPDNSQYLSARTFSMLQEANEISDEILISDEVASVELVGDATVYDLRLESEHLYSCQGFNLHNSGRRGALMECIEVRHPDIFSFIEMKQDLDKQWFFNDLKDAGVNINDWKYSSIADRLKSTSHANVSVLIDNKFIEAVENDEDYELWYEFDNNQYPRISKFVKARDIWNKLIEGATNSAEPGILNMELIRKESPADCYSDIEEYTIYDSVEGKSKKVKYSFKTHATNPCVSYDSYVLTNLGYRQVSDLLDTPWIAVVNNKEYNATPFWKTGDKEVFEILLADGSKIKTTADHKLMLMDGSWCNASDCLGKKLMPNNVESYIAGITNKEFQSGWLVGSILGDGYYTSKSGSAVMFWGNERNTIATYANSCLERNTEVAQTNTIIKIRTNTINKLLGEILEINTKEIKSAIYTKSKEFISGFLSGILDSDGSVQGTATKGYSVRIAQSNVTMLKHCQRLFSMLGVSSTVYENRRLEQTKYWKQGNKEYTSKAQHELVIASSNLIKLQKATQFITLDKNIKLATIIETTNFYNKIPSTKVISIVSTGIESVYDCTVDIIHQFDLNGIIAHNCGELPLSVGDSCCLGTHNLPAFVINPYKDNAKFDWVGFAETVKLSTRAQDNIKNIDIRLVPLVVNRVSAILGRRIGLGCTGLSDALAMLGLRYDTEEAIKVSERIYATLRDSVYAASIQLAEEKGAFPIYDAKKEINNPFLKRLPKELQGKPRRNIACLTNAPNGSMSILMDNTASGIEPCFDTAEYTRNVKKPGTNDFIQFKVQHQAYSDCITAGGNTACFVKANDIDGMMRIKLQSTLQKYIDHAISVTTNLPAGTTQEHVGNLYLQAFKSGCKGFTVYVDGCRTGVLNSIKEDVAKTHKVVERPKTTDVDIFKTKYKEKNYMILVGKTNNGPIEVFGGEEAEGLSLPTKYKKAELTKKSRGHYTLTVQLSEDPEDILKINNVGNRFPAQDVITLTRMISLSLRNGVSVSDICEQLQKSATGLYDAPAVFARVLKNYISDEEVAARMKNKPCPDCGKELKAKRESGCIVEYCESCAYVNSKCS